MGNEHTAFGVDRNNGKFDMITDISYEWFVF